MVSILEVICIVFLERRPFCRVNLFVFNHKIQDKCIVKLYCLDNNRAFLFHKEKHVTRYILMVVEGKRYLE